MSWLINIVKRLFARRTDGEMVSLGLGGADAHHPRSANPSIWERSPITTTPGPHPANVAGDFYVENNCCTMCGVPFVEAPELFGTYTDALGYEQCVVKRQPSTPPELGKMLSAIAGAELQCIRYSGRDRSILRQLVEIGERDVCDHLPEDL